MSLLVWYPLNGDLKDTATAKVCKRITKKNQLCKY